MYDILRIWRPENKYSIEMTSADILFWRWLFDHLQWYISRPQSGIYYIQAVSDSTTVFVVTLCRMKRDWCPVDWLTYGIVIRTGCVHSVFIDRWLMADYRSVEAYAMMTVYYTITCGDDVFVTHIQCNTIHSVKRLTWWRPDGIGTGDCSVQADLIDDHWYLKSPLMTCRVDSDITVTGIRLLWRYIVDCDEISGDILVITAAMEARPVFREADAYLCDYIVSYDAERYSLHCDTVFVTVILHYRYGGIRYPEWNYLFWWLQWWHSLTTILWCYSICYCVDWWVFLICCSVGSLLPCCVDSPMTLFCLFVMFVILIQYDILSDDTLFVLRYVRWGLLLVRASDGCWGCQYMTLLIVRVSCYFPMIHNVTWWPVFPYVKCYCCLLIFIDTIIEGGSVAYIILINCEK